MVLVVVVVAAALAIHYPWSNHCCPTPKAARAGSDSIPAVILATAVDVAVAAGEQVAVSLRRPKCWPGLARGATTRPMAVVSPHVAAAAAAAAAEPAKRRPVNWLFLILS